MEIIPSKMRERKVNNLSKTTNALIFTKQLLVFIVRGGRGKDKSVHKVMSNIK